MVEERAGRQPVIRLSILVEGKTEREFVRELLAPHLITHGVSATASLIGKPGYKGGNVTVDRIASDVPRLAHSSDAVTTLVDFYGFRQRPTKDVDALQQEIDRACRNAANQRLRDDRLFAYVQLYEFEALLFSSPDAFERSLAVPRETARTLQSVRGGFGTPEDIDDGQETAPSKRIDQALPDYHKVLDGILVATEIGLDTMRRECPRFGAWVSRLEALGSDVTT